jgi:serine/threonine-protein kinase
MLLHQVINDEPPSPRRLNAAIPKDRETICLKCLEKDRTRRFATAADLSAELRRYLADEPILSRPVSRAERLWRWSKRNPRVAALSTTILALVLAITVGSIVAVVLINEQKDAAVQLADEKGQLAIEKQQLAEQEHKASEESKENARKAEANATVAREQSQLALDTLGNVVTKVDEQLRDPSEMHKLRQELIEDAMAGLRRVEESNGTRSLVDRSMGVGHQRMADIFQQMGRSEDALAAHQRALVIFETLLKSNPQDHWARWDAAISNDKVGDLNRVLGGAATDVRSSYLKALQHREKLPTDLNREKLTADDVKRSLVNSYAKLGTTSLAAGDLAAASEYFGKMLAQSEELYAKNPNNPQARQALSGSYLVLGRVSFRMQDVEAARDYYDKSLKLRQQLVASDPLSVGFRRLVAAAFDASGDLSLQLSKAPDKAIENYENSRQIYAELHATNPKDADSQSGLAAAHYRLGTARVLVGKAQEAKADYTESLRLREDLLSRDPKNTTKIIGLIHVRARLGLHDESFQAAEELRERVGTDPSALYNLVCGYSLCASAARHGRPIDDMSTAERQAYDRYLSAAIETLRSATDRGYNDVTALETDPDLGELRDSSDFDALIRGLKK